MKKLLTFIVLVGTFSMVGCHKGAAKEFEELMNIVAELGFSQAEFLDEAGGIADGDSEVYTLFNYHPKNGKNRLVIEHISIDGDDSWYGIDMAGWHDVLVDIQGKSDADKETALVEFMNNASHGELERIGLEDISFYEEGTGELFAESNQSSKDLESMGAKIEINNAEDFSEELVADYGLSVKRAQTVARTINVYQRLSSKRSLTTRELNYYSQELLGVDYKKARDAIIEGENFDQLMEKAAEKNGTSPEQISAIIRDKLL